MAKNPKLKAVIYFTLLIVLVTGLSPIFTHIWGGNTERIQKSNKLIISPEMTIGEFGQINGLPDSVLKEIFNLKVKSDQGRTLREYGTPDQIASMVNKKIALLSEHASKNWVKIPIKFGLWFLFLLMVFILAKNKNITSDLRKRLLFTAVLIFGVIMGSDPSPMGTVKDAIHLYGTTGAIFPPRIIALTIFLTIVFLVNKYICAWGCQAGTLQDLIFRINQTEKRKAIIGKQIKLPFALTNTFRFVFLCVFTAATFLWGFDIINPIDPFKIYKPMHLGLIGGISVGTVLLTSLFVYRPWCHLFCPFGFTGWLVEKVSLVKISVNYETCIACEKCAASCPSTVMSAILRHDKITIPDCFACYTCTEVCPTNSIRMSSGKRALPPADHFNKG
jgi:Pyruvate/2-oxoacid:ferredoxin oxidoreductase delta subunit